MRNRRNVRTNKNKELLANKKFMMTIEILIIIIILSTGIIAFRKYQDNLLLAKQKEELTKQTEEIYTDIANLTSQDNGMEESKTIKISAVGDILCGTDMLADANDGSNNYDFHHMFANITQYTKNSDLSLGTFETNIVDSDYSGITKYNSPESFLQAIKETGISLVSLAHNHALDYGKSGLDATVKAINAQGMSITGIQNNSENENKEFTGIIKDVKGIKVAVLSYTYGLSNPELISEEEKNYANIYSKEKSEKDLEYAKSNSNYIIVIMHWGEVNDTNISEWQENVTNELIENGADMILGSHPSVIEPMKIIKNKDGKNILVAYSLGNYISSFKYENSDVELILNMEIIKKSDEEKAILKKVDYTPIYVLDNEKNDDDRFELCNMKGLALDYTNGNSKNISRKTYNKLINKLEWLDGIVNRREN